MEILDLIVSNAPLANPTGPGDMILGVQGGVVKRFPPLKIVSSTIGGAAVIIDMASVGLLGPFLLQLRPFAGNTLKVELSRDNQTTYQQWGGSWAVDLDVFFTKGPADSSFVTHVKLTRVTGASSANTYTLANGYTAFTGPQQDRIGVVRSKILVVDGVTRIKKVDPINDRGYVSISLGIDTNIFEIQNEAFAGFAWDASLGFPCFGLLRASSSAAFVNPQTATNRGAVANQAARLALSGAVVGDGCYQTDTSTAYVLTNAGPSTNGNWTALPAGTPVEYCTVVIDNPTGRELVLGGPPVVWLWVGVNHWVVV